MSESLRPSHVALWSECESFHRDGGPADVACKPLEFCTRVRLDADAGVQRKARILRDAFCRPLLRLCWQCLQREHLLSGTRTDGHPIGDRVADQVMHGSTRLGVGGEEAMFAIAHQ